MNPISPQSWFLKCGITAALSLSVYALVSFAGPKAPPLTKEGAVPLLDRYVNEPVPDVLLVGSSFTGRLNEEYFDTPDIKVLGLPGGSSITALRVALARDHLPKIILIEMNVLTRGEDSELVQKITQRDVPWPSPIRSAIAFYERWRHGPPDRASAKAAAVALLQGAPSDFDNRIYLERAVRGWSTAPADAIVTSDLMALKRLIESIEVRGSRAYLYLLPFASPLEESAYAKVTANAARAAFPDDRQWVRIDGSLPDLRWPDGAHLDERSGFMIAKQIDHFLTGVAGGP